uniref:TNFR-Cys domain-containing protein n=1 Tax=Brugia timori TaxID=42155 RepID=A0A0R3QT42_9BILA
LKFLKASFFWISFPFVFRKILGCERCLREFGCNLSGKDHKELQACYQCEHGLTALNDHTDDCQCQIPLLASHLSGLQSHFLPVTNPP